LITIYNLITTSRFVGSFWGISRPGSAFVTYYYQQIILI